MRVLIAGGSGFVGSALIRDLKFAGHQTAIIARDPKKFSAPSVGWGTEELIRAVSEYDAVVNLAGEPIIGKRWNEKQKQRLWDSRIGSTKKLVDAMKEAKTRPKVFISASAEGYYGPRGDEALDETDSGGNDFLAGLCKKWEEEALRAKSLGIRTAIIRLGVVLGMGGGALSKMVPQFKLGLGGPLGHGRQYLSWIHISDLARLFLFLLEREGLEGAFNGTAPNPATNREFSKTLGRVLRRPALFPVPGFILKLALGEAADAILTGQRVMPKRTLEAGFEFRFSNLEEALRNLALAHGP